MPLKTTIKPKDIPNFEALGGIINLIKGLQNIMLKEMKELSHYKPNLEGNNELLSWPVYHLHRRRYKLIFTTWYKQTIQGTTLVLPRPDSHQNTFRLRTIYLLN